MERQSTKQLKQMRQHNSDRFITTDERNLRANSWDTFFDACIDRHSF